MATDVDPLLNKDLERGSHGPSSPCFFGRIVGATLLVTVVLGLVATVVVLGVLLDQARNDNSAAQWGCQAAPFAPASTAELAQAHAEARAQMTQQWPYATDGQSAALVLWGLDSAVLAGTDTELTFLQESNFLYVTGVDEPGCAAVFFVELGEWTLFVPRRDARYAVWNGYVLSLDDWQQKTGATSVLYADEFQSYVSNTSAAFAARQPPVELVFYQTATVTPPPALQLPANVTLGDSKRLTDALRQSRVLKTPTELRLLAVASSVSAQAHAAVMRYVRPGMFEYQAETRFLEYTGSCSLLQPSYLPIVGAGYNSAILHYVANDALMNASDVLLIDAAADYHGYASDITRTYPVAGCYSQRQRVVYQMVLNVQQQSIDKIAPGANWNQISAEAGTLVLQQLVANDFLVGDVAEMASLRCNSLFMSHGLGHTVGLDVHDATYSSVLQPGMVYTVEPGIYFNDALLLSPGECGRFFVNETIDWYLQHRFGGVRIEDVILVEPAPTNYTILSAAVPRTIDQIEKIMGCHR